MKIINYIKSLCTIDEDDIRAKAKCESVKRFNIERISYNQILYDVITLDGIPVSMCDRDEEAKLVERLAKYRDMYVQMSVENKQVI